MSVMKINSASTMQAQLLQEMQQMRVSAQLPVHSSMQIEAAGTPSPVSFDQIMQGALSHVDQFQQIAEQKQTAIDMGTSDDLAGTMIAGQQASLSFSALVQVRNKIASGFNDLMSISI
ncbi:flagellar hook-basal body complex protein FliE [Citrobacter farmeri]|uniref:flagellar hook-basal body complex protein FliE n=1 Tax=Citrobacter farmeri TaxID=67824 RepID=UPI0018A0B6CD|nr:flagellar hook-basal body complex protein FliE [Citrobacter farmeri]EHK0945848.1 flagellar hook-basal body complex protein FliE [Citrobacter farmeri]EKU0082229.1 flagellar hook-basal body complex protein FliE [Citrobacter farmeri]EKX4541438.1 flagellar hook-basal body complex protein FliE [Citrobacter farmeri]MDB2166228.1 flagellar hook-basal body complex protein FliE [Citrobacter farmeri]HBC0358503.1 flagellar hook-basal body complex protein FliE [Citrobacter farmeri]